MSDEKHPVKFSDCPYCGKTVHVEPENSTYSKWFGGWAVVCPSCRIHFTGAGTRIRACLKAANLDRHYP